jgi:hypothetical protein
MLYPESLRIVDGDKLLFPNGKSVAFRQCGDSSSTSDNEWYVVAVDFVLCLKPDMDRGQARRIVREHPVRTFDDNHRRGGIKTNYVSTDIADTIAKTLRSKYAGFIGQSIDPVRRRLVTLWVARETLARVAYGMMTMSYRNSRDRTTMLITREGLCDKLRTKCVEVMNTPGVLQNYPFDNIGAMDDVAAVIADVTTNADIQTMCAMNPYLPVEERARFGNYADRPHVLDARFGKVKVTERANIKDNYEPPSPFIKEIMDNHVAKVNVTVWKVAFDNVTLDELERIYVPRGLTREEVAARQRELTEERVETCYPGLRERAIAGRQVIDEYRRNPPPPIDPQIDRFTFDTNQLVDVETKIYLHEGPHKLVGTAEPIIIRGKPVVMYSGRAAQYLDFDLTEACPFVTLVSYKHLVKAVGLSPEDEKRVKVWKKFVFDDVFVCVHPSDREYGRFLSYKGVLEFVRSPPVRARMPHLHDELKALLDHKRTIFDVCLDIKNRNDTAQELVVAMDALAETFTTDQRSSVATTGPALKLYVHWNMKSHLTMPQI